MRIVIHPSEMVVVVERRGRRRRRRRGEGVRMRMSGDDAPVEERRVRSMTCWDVGVGVGGGIGKVYGERWGG